MKKFLSLLLSLILLSALCLPVSAAHVTAPEAIGTLETLGLVRGTENGFEPERAATRAEAVVMLLRLLGLEQNVAWVSRSSPFQDGGWADAYLSFAYDLGLIKGVSATAFGSDSPVSARDYVTMTLRALGYVEGWDFTWQDSLYFSDSIGLTHREYTGAEYREFLREDMALVSYTALTQTRKAGDMRLIDALYLAGAVTSDALKQTRFADAINAGRPEYTAVEIHEMASSAVFYAEVFENEENLLKNKPMSRGSGFLISGDGVAVINYHELEGASYARATLTDGRVFDIAGVLYYDVLRDAAVVRLSMTDTAGETVRFFPYLDIGDSDAVSTGDPIYVVANPLGLIDNITSGLVSNRSRVVDDPAYPCIQITAPTAQGSSGGPILNRHGDVIGFVYGSYTQGQNMNLAVPVNCIRGVDTSAAGIPLSEVREVEDAKKASAEITAEETEIAIEVGEERDVVISSDFPGTLIIQYNIGDSDVVRCAWGSFVTKQSIPLKLTGVGAGSTEVEITFADEDGNPDALLVLSVTVTDPEAEAEGTEEAGGGEDAAEEAPETQEAAEAPADEAPDAEAEENLQ